MTFNKNIKQNTGPSNKYPEVENIKIEGLTEALMFAKGQLKQYPLEKRRFFEGYIDFLCKYINNLKDIELW
jgi:hypothetical protein